MTKQLLTVDDAAERTTLSPWTIRKLLASGKLPHIKLGRRVAIAEDALQNFVDQGRIEGQTGNKQ
jgi:excisionase family DNA binding protein